MADGDLTTLAKVKAWLSIISEGEDVLLSGLITAVSAFIQGPEGIGYQVASQGYTVVKDGHGGVRLVLGSKPPLTAVASLKIGDQEIPPASDTRTAGYRFTDNSLILQGYLFVPGNGNVEVTCTRGWVATPMALEQACIELVAYKYKGRDHIGQASKTLQQGSVAFVTKDMPDEVKTVLQAWKKVVP